jgi:hypothetical protein
LLYCFVAAHAPAITSLLVAYGVAGASAAAASAAGGFSASPFPDQADADSHDNSQDHRSYQYGAEISGDKGDHMHILLFL